MPITMNNTKHYEFQQKDGAELDRLRYFFASIGVSTIIKAIEYTPIGEFPIGELKGRRVCNLGFGDYVEETDEIVDDVNSNNGDIFIVFNTVLHTVPDFFTKYPNDIIIVSGSDSKDDFSEKCRLTCKKKNKCKVKCANIDRRINTYRYYVDKHFDELCENYVILGIDKLDGTVISYKPYNDYKDILVYKK